MRTRVTVTALIATLALLAFTSAALACNEPGISTSSSSAGPNSPVGWSISGMDPGADYRVTVDGNVVASGTSSGGGESGSFTMPDHGSSARTVEVVSEVRHEGGYWPSYRSVTYAPPPQPAQPAQANPVNAGPSAGDSSSGGSQGKGGGGNGSGPNGSPASSSSPSAPAVSATAAPVSAPQQAANETEVSEQAASEEANSSAPDRVFDAVAGETDVGPAEMPTLVLIAAAFLAGLALGGIAVAIWYMRNGPDPQAASLPQVPYGPDPIEAELQEIIGESMARELLEPGGSADARERIAGEHVHDAAAAERGL